MRKRFGETACKKFNVSAAIQASSVRVAMAQQAGKDSHDAVPGRNREALQPVGINIFGLAHVAQAAGDMDVPLVRPRNTAKPTAICVRVAQLKGDRDQAVEEKPILTPAKQKETKIERRQNAG